MFSQCPYNTAATKGLAGRFLNMPSPVFGGHDSRDICPLAHNPLEAAPCAIPPQRLPSPVHSPLWRAIWATYFASVPSACRLRSRYRTGKASPPGRRALKGRGLWRTLSQQSAFQATLLSRKRTPFARPPHQSKVFGREGMGVWGKGGEDFLQKGLSSLPPPRPGYSAFTSPTMEMSMSRARTTLRKRASSTVENQRLPNHMPPNMGTIKTRVKMTVSRLMSPCCQ